MVTTQKHIADALNLSIITVSRALRGHPDLSESTRSRIVEKARELGYSKAKVKQIAEQSAAPPRRAGIFFFEARGQHEDPLASGVKRSIFLSLQRECQRLQVETLIETISGNETPLVVKNRTISAAFVFGRYTPENVAHLRDIPVLAVSSFIDCHGLPRIVADNLNGTRLATEHLVELGHRKILFIGQRDPNTRIFDERADGYVSAMHRHDLIPKTQFLDTDKWSPEIDAMRPFTAIVCDSDSMAYAVQAKLLAAGFRLPQEFSIVGFDDLATESPIPITTYAPDWSMMGRIAAGLLLSHPIDVRGLNLSVTVPGALIIRNSTAKPGKR